MVYLSRQKYIRKQTHRINSIFADLDGTLIYTNDILLFRRTEVEYDRRLQEILKRARDSGLKFFLTKSH